MTAMATAGFCQYPTELDRYGMPASTCGAPAVEHRPDCAVVRFICRDHRDNQAYTQVLDELADPGDLAKYLLKIANREADCA
jgi:hypothetical protein